MKRTLPIGRLLLVGGVVAAAVAGITLVAINATDGRDKHKRDVRAVAPETRPPLVPIATVEPTPAPARAGGRFLIGTLDKSIEESSGIVASRKYPGVFWTHSDSGNAAVIYAVARDGTLLADFTLDVPNGDFEDIAQDDQGHLYLGDIGNNAGNLAERYVHRVSEPNPYGDDAPEADGKKRKKGKNAKGRKGNRLKVADTWTFLLPDRKFDIESLVVLGGKAYVITKRFNLEQATIYRFDLADPKTPKELEKVTDLPIRAPVTAADVSADGKWLAVLSVSGPYLFQIDGDVARAGKVPAAHAILLNPKTEAICFVDDGVLTTTEEREMYLFRWGQFKGGAVPTTPLTTAPATEAPARP